MHFSVQAAEILSDGTRLLSDATCQDFSQRGFRVPKVFYASYDENFDVRPTLEALEAEEFSYVAKASHLCCAQGVFVMDKGFDRSAAEICFFAIGIEI